MLNKPKSFKLFNNPAAIPSIVACIWTEYYYHIELSKDSTAVYFVCPVHLQDGSELGLQLYCSVDYKSHDVYNLSWFMKAKGTRCISISNYEIYIMENNHETDFDDSWIFDRNVLPGVAVLKHLDMTPSDFADLLSLTKFILDIGKKIQDGR